MSAIRQDITIEQGADYDTPFFLQDDDGSPDDLTGCSFVMQVKLDYDSPAILTLSSADGSLAIDAYGVVRPFIGYATTAALYAGTYVYDIRERTPNGRTRRRRQGVITVTRQVTTALPGTSPSPSPAPAPAPAPSPSPSPSPAPIYGQLNFSIAGNSGLIAGAL